MIAKFKLLILTIPLVLILSGIITANYYSFKTVVDSNLIITDSCECNVKNKTASIALEYILCCKDNCASFTTNNYTEFILLGNLTKCWIIDGIVTNTKPNNSLAASYFFYLFLINLAFLLLALFIFNVGIYIIFYFSNLKLLNNPVYLNEAIVFFIFVIFVSLPLHLLSSILIFELSVMQLIVFIPINICTSFFMTSIFFITINRYICKLLQNKFPNLLII